MTMNFTIQTFAEDPVCLLNIPGDSNEHKNEHKIRLDWVTHGNFALSDSNDYMSLEKQHFAEILEAYEYAPKPSGRTPFWTGIVPVRGLTLSESLVEAYACAKPYIALIDSSCTNMSGLGVPCYHNRLIVSVETFREASAAVQQRIAAQQKINSAREGENEEG